LIAFCINPTEINKIEEYGEAADGVSKKYFYIDDIKGGIYWGNLDNDHFKKGRVLYG